MKTADTAHRGFLQVTPGPFPNLWVGPGDEAKPTPYFWSNFLYRVKVYSNECPSQNELHVAK